MIRALVPLLMLVAAAAASPPEVDVGALCLEMGWTGTYTSSTILAECRRWENAALDRLAPVWESLPPGVRHHCGHLASSNGTGSYRALELCVRASGIGGAGGPY